MEVTLTVNGRATTLEVGAGETILTALRERLRLTGTKEGCNEGECGACTVLLDGLPVDSCIYAAAAAAGRRVETIEGLVREGLGRHLQDAFVARGGVQCGFCTPGFVATCVAVLRPVREGAEEKLSEDDLRTALAGNICRCTGYSQILDAVAEAAATADRAPAQVSGS